MCYKICLCIPEYDTLKRIGIDNPPTFVLKHFSDKEGQNVKVLCTRAIGETILNQLDGAVDDIRTTGPGWIDSLVSIWNSYRYQSYLIYCLGRVSTFLVCTFFWGV